MPAPDSAPAGNAYEPPVPPPAGDAPQGLGPISHPAGAAPQFGSADPATPSVKQKTKFRINRVETVADIIGAVVWISIAVSWTNILTALDRMEFPVEIPLPSAELIGAYYVWIVNVALVGIAVSVLKLIIGRWTFPVGIVHTVYQSMNAILTVTILNSNMLLRPETAARWAELSDGATVAQIYASVDVWGGIIGVLISILVVIDIIARWVDVAKCSSASTE